ncbi:hypothetical protein [Streptomyces sp. WAC05858]|uniref:hypothetical protein n=1 Tax=Streptomyces TaxID=1883 RepID=UPI00163C6709|nr:hypothetical protein [Streptomyces sp. WAC05858]
MLDLAGPPGQGQCDGQAVVRCVCAVETPVRGDLVSATHTYTGAGWEWPLPSRSTLRFLGPDALAGCLSEAGLAVAEQFGGWGSGPLTGTGPEIITVARRPRGERG